MLRGDISDEVFAWLDEGLDPSPGAYLALLHPSLRGERGERILVNLKAIATRLRDRPEDWGTLIRARDWRPTLVGCSAVLLARDARFLDDLLSRFREGSWVAPQLAVALGLVHPDEAVTEFERVVREAGSSTDFKRLFTAHAALKLMGREVPEESEAGEFFGRSQLESPGRSRAAYDAQIAVRVIRDHWAFWSRQGSP